MIECDRRTVLAGTAAASLLVAAPTFARGAAVQPSLFVFDARFAASQAAARSKQVEAVRVLDPREEDLGVAWRGTIPALLQGRAKVIAGITLWSDMFICESFAREHGLRLIASAPVSGSGDLIEWVLA